VILMANNGPARLLRNEGTANRRVRITLKGSSSNRDAIGARVRLLRPGGPTPWRMVKTGSSYLSQSELPLTFGLGTSPEISGVEVVWPDGKTHKLPAIAAGSSVVITEAKGVSQTTPLEVRK
jgi:hypothetical protein